MASGVNVNGSRELSWNVNLSTEKALKAARDLKKELKDLADAAKLLGSQKDGSANFVTAQGRMTKAMRDSLAETQRLIQEGVRLRNEYEAGRISAQQLAAQTRVLNDQRRAEAAAARAARQAQTAVTGSYREAQQRLRELGDRIRSVEGGFNNLGRVQQARIREYRQLNERLLAFDRTMGNHQRNVGNYSGALSAAGRSLVSLTSIYVSAFAALSGVSTIIRNNSEISDSLADVQRTAGLTTKEIDALVVSLKKIDTRTSLKSLLDIAIIGGQLGIAKDQLGGFTKAVDQLSVSLSGELAGGAAGIAKSLGILNNVFGIAKKEGGDVEKAFNKIGSVILGLGQSGLATGDYLADFGERVGGIAAQAGLSLPVLLSYGAVLQENGVSAEVAGTAFKKLIGSIATKREKFFAVAQIADASLTLTEFTDIINTDTQKALQLFFNGLEKGGPKTTQFLDLLKGVGLDAARSGQAISALSLHQQDLNKHISESIPQFEDATLSAEQFKIKNETLAASIDKLGNAITNITTNPNSNIGDYFGRFIRALTGGIKGVDVAIGRIKELRYNMAIENFDRKGETGNFFIGVDDVKEEKARRAAKARDDRNKEAIKIAGNLYRDATLDIKANGDAVERLAIEETKLNEIRKQFGSRGALTPEGQMDLDKSLIVQKELVKKLREEYEKPVKGEGVSLDGKADKAEENKLKSAINSRNTLQAQIDALTKKGVDKQLSADEQEVESVRDKYEKMREAAVKFNNDPVNKKKGLRVDSGGLVAAEKTEIRSLGDKQGADKIKEGLEHQKKLYDEFESYKDKVGSTKAKERFASQLDTERSYLEDLKMQRDNLEGGSFVTKEDVTKQLKVLDDAIADETIAQDKKQAQLLADFVSYADERKALTERYERDLAVIGDNPGSREKRTKRYQDELKQLDFENLKKLESYEKLFEGIDGLSTKSALKQVERARGMLDKDILSGAITDPEEIAKIKAYFNQVERTIREGSGKALQDLGAELQNVASSVGEVNAEFGKMLGVIANVVGKVGDIKAGMADLKIASGKGKNGMADFSGMGQLTAGLGIFSAGLSIFSSIFKLFDRSAQREEQAAYSRDLQNKQTESLNKILERQISLLDDVYGTERITNYGIALEQAQQLEEKYLGDLSGKFLTTNNAETNKLIQKINNGEKAKDIFEKLAMSDLLKGGALKSIPKDIDQLRILLAEGKLDANTSVIVQNLIQANESAIQLANNLRKEVTGTSIEQIADDFISTLTDGTQDFGKTFEETIRKSILNGFKGKLIEDQLQAFYTQFAGLSKDGLTDKEIETLRGAYLSATEKAKTDLDALAKATGIDLKGGNSASRGALTGSDALTESTAKQIPAAFNGMRLAQVETNALLRPISKGMGDLYEIATGNLALQVKTEQNTRNTATNTADALPYLKNIADNTKDSLATQLRAAGKFGYVLIAAMSFLFNN